ncbi:MAG: TldD/PmbA family protein [Erysipelotrichaceae bacterium]|jgi:PmbA protein|nr:TldD/PmbA family protein [Erysipelotrichaceae bacterium]
MNFKKLFELAKASGLEAIEITSSTAKSTSVELYHGEIESQQIEEDTTTQVRGILNGKFGVISTPKLETAHFKSIINDIKENAAVIEKPEKAIIFKGSPKYRKRTFYNQRLVDTPIGEKIAKLYEIEKQLKDLDPRITEIMSVAYAESSFVTGINNSYGLKLSAKGAYYYYSAYIMVKENDEVKTGGEIFLSDDLEKFDITDLVRKTAEDALSKLGGTQCESKKYPILLNPDSFAALLGAFIASTSSEEVQRNSSALKDMLNQEVASKIVTIEERPLVNNFNYRYFDDEGVATYNKRIVDKGILKTFLYNLETAAKEGRETTGNGYGKGGKVGIGYQNLYVKPGKKTKDQIITTIKEGILINELQGLHAGLDERSGDFSLQTNGFLIKDGKIDRPLSLITVAGNLFQLMKDIRVLSKDNKLLLNGMELPYALIKNLAVSGK